MNDTLQQELIAYLKAHLNVLFAISYGDSIRAGIRVRTNYECHTITSYQQAKTLIES